MEKTETNALEIIKSDSLSFIIESTDSIIDLASSSNLIDEIPIIGLISKVGKIGFGVNNHLFEKKLYSFLFEIKDITATEREKFVTKLHKKEYSEIGNSITILLDKYESLTKATYLGKLMKATIKQEISSDDFMRIATIINRLMLFDIQKLSLFQEEVVHSGNYVIELENQGLIERTGKKVIGNNSHTNYWNHFYRLSSLGRTIIKYLEL